MTRSQLVVGSRRIAWKRGWLSALLWVARIACQPVEMLAISAHKLVSFSIDSTNWSSKARNRELSTSSWSTDSGTLEEE
jgi:hypothetical protein